MCIPGDALPPGARRRRRAGGRPGLFPREAQLDPSQLLAQQSCPQTELPESRRRRRFKTHRMDFPRGSAGAGSHPRGEARPSLRCSSSPNPPDTPSMDTCTSLSLWESIPELQLEPDSSLFQGKLLDFSSCLMTRNKPRSSQRGGKGFYPQVLSTRAQPWLQDSREVMRNTKGRLSQGKSGCTPTGPCLGVLRAA